MRESERKYERAGMKLDIRRCRNGWESKRKAEEGIEGEGGRQEKGLGAWGMRWVERKKGEDPRREKRIFGGERSGEI